MSLLLLLVRCPIAASQDLHMDFSNTLTGTRMATRVWIEKSKAWCGRSDFENRAPPDSCFVLSLGKPTHSNGRLDV